MDPGSEPDTPAEPLQNRFQAHDNHSWCRSARLLESERDDLRNRLDRAEQERGVTLRLLEDQRKPRTWSLWPIRR